MAKARTPVWLRVTVTGVSFTLYVVACVLPAAAFSVASNDSESSGLGLLLCGWMDGPQACLPWSSNFLWLAGAMLLAFGKPGWGWGCAAAGLLFASRVLLPYTGAVLLEAKYWWLCSYAALAAGCGAACVRSWVVGPRVPGDESLAASAPPRDGASDPRRGPGR